jgi:hypothetical protein
MTTNGPDDPLERLLDRTLHELPLRRAPLTLESRVIGELERRAALPWWRRSFAHWPLLARAGLLVICGLVGLALVGGATAIADVRSLSWARQVGALVASGGNLAALLAHTAPPTWLYAGIAVCALLYAVLFGLGAAMYRTLYLQPTGRVNSMNRSITP